MCAREGVRDAEFGDWSDSHWEATVNEGVPYGRCATIGAATKVAELEVASSVDTLNEYIAQYPTLSATAAD